jgi:hypothetical protein
MPSRLPMTMCPKWSQVNLPNLRQRLTCHVTDARAYTNVCIYIYIYIYGPCGPIDPWPSMGPWPPMCPHWLMCHHWPRKHAATRENHMMQTTQSSKNCSAAVLGCSSARGWMQLVLLVIMVVESLMLRLWGSFLCTYVCVCCCSFVDGLLRLLLVHVC